MLGKCAYLFVVFDMEGHAKKCVERFCELANKTTQQLYKVSTPCINDNHFKEEDLCKMVMWMRGSFLEPKNECLTNRML